VPVYRSIAAASGVAELPHELAGEVVAKMTAERWIEGIQFCEDLTVDES
jgi:hypothetical protein